MIQVQVDSWPFCLVLFAMRKERGFIARHCDMGFSLHSRYENDLYRVKKKKEASIMKTKIPLSVGKVILTVPRKFQGGLHVNLLHNRRTINAAYYLHEEVLAEYWSKKRRQPIRDVLLSHDSAKPHCPIALHYS